MNRILLLLALTLAGCGSPGTGSNLFNTGRDARVYNPATGRYEWPEEELRPKPRKTDSPRTTAPQPDMGDGRAYDPATGRWE